MDRSDGPSYVDPSTALIVSARHQNFKTVLGLTGQKDLGTPSFTDVIVKSTTVIDAKNKVSVLGIYSPEFFERTIDNVYEITDGNYDNQLATSYDTKSLLGLNWRSLTGTSSVLENAVYYRGNSADFRRSNSYVYPVNGVVPAKKDAFVRQDYYLYNSKESEAGFRSQFTYSPSPVHSLLLGAQANSVHYQYFAKQVEAETLYTYGVNDFRPNPAQQFIVIDPAFVNSDASATKQNAAAYAEYTYSPTEAFRLVPSVRYEYNGFNAHSAVSPRLSASYFLNERIKLSAAAGVYRQPVELRTISLDVRNAALNDQKAVHYIAGITAYLTDDVKVTAEVYHKDLSDLIVKTDRTSDLRKNVGTGHARGIDLGLVKKFTEKWYGQVNYSYSSSLRNDHDGLGEYRSDFDQPHIFNILFGYEFNSEWSFSTKWKYATGRPSDAYIVHANVLNDVARMRYSKEVLSNNTERFPDFHTWNMRVDYRTQLGATAIVAFLDVLNLYNRLNVNEERFIETTGAVVPKGFRIIPSFGMKLEL